MRRIILGALFAILPIVATVSSANAQAIRTWVSGVGDDVNPCSRSAPCKTFAGAISKTAAGGEINCLDAAGFGALTITKSISVICVGVLGGVTAAGTNAFIINAGRTDVVVLKGLDLEGGGSAVLGINGIRFLAGGALHVEDVFIRGFHAGSPNGNGIIFAPSAGIAELTVTNTTIMNNGTGNTGGGILIEPTGSGGTRVVIENTRVENNGVGVLVRGGSSTGDNAVTIRNSVLSGNTTFGLVVTESGAGVSEVMLKSSSASNNERGVSAAGDTGIVRMRNSTVARNTIAGLVASSNSRIISHGGNVVAGNGTNGAFTNTVAQQ